jgi:hypothetical protein
MDAFLQVDEDKQFRCSSQEADQLYTTSSDLAVPPTMISRAPRDETERTRVWCGNIGSGNSMMGNAGRRDELRDTYDLIGLEMEAAGVMNTLPTGVIRGVCDYGDGQKYDDWHPYAAAAAADIWCSLQHVIQRFQIITRRSIKERSSWLSFLQSLFSNAQEQLGHSVGSAFLEENCPPIGSYCDLPPVLGVVDRH